MQNIAKTAKKMGLQNDDRLMYEKKGKFLYLGKKLYLCSRKGSKCIPEI